MTPGPVQSKAAPHTSRAEASPAVPKVTRPPNVPLKLIVAFGGTMMEVRRTRSYW